jgi:CspA family cold shock protein
MDDLDYLAWRTVHSLVNVRTAPHRGAAPAWRRHRTSRLRYPHQAGSYAFLFCDACSYMPAGPGGVDVIFDFSGLLRRAPASVRVTALKELPMPIGTVKFFNADKGYGFIAPEDGGTDAFVHITAVEAAGMRTLTQNQRVSYELQPDKRGKAAAVNLQSV